MADKKYKRYKVSKKVFTSRGPVETRKVESVEYTFPCIVNESSGGLPITCEIYNVMGQEDIFRHVDDVRVFRYLFGRIVVTTGFPADIEINYSPNSLDLDLTTGVIDTDDPGLYHEVYIEDLNVDSLYAFIVTATVRNIEGDETDYEELCPDPVVSEIYYFQTGGVVDSPDFSFVAIPSMAVVIVELSSVETSLTTYIDIADSIYMEEIIIEILSSIIVPDEIEKSLTTTNLYTTHSIVSP